MDKMRTLAFYHTGLAKTDVHTLPISAKALNLAIEILKHFHIPSAGYHSNISALLDFEMGIIGFGRGDQTGNLPSAPWRPFLIITLRELELLTLVKVEKKVQIEDRVTP